MAKKKGRKLKAFGITVLVLLILLVIIVGAIFLFINNKLGKMQQVDLNEEDLNVSAEVAENLSKFRNIAIFGIDSREDTYSKGNRSDCIIIASMNNETKEVKLVSVYRDTYVQIEGHGLDKITHAYSYGEAPLAIKTLNTNFDLNITEFVTVNFDAVKDIVDDVGGISMNITSEEVSHIPGIKKAGTQTLTGEQALAYARIRHASGGDYKRTERMRDVLTAVVSMIPSATSIKITDSIGWPYETKGITLDRWYGVPITLESNVTRLHKEVFGETDYVPSETVKQISNDIIEKTGYSE